jgi:hypothetical protein
MDTWKQGDSYDPGTVVLHQGKAYTKLDDGDNSPPDAVPGGWQELETSNVAEYQAIEASFSSYEERKAKHQAEVRSKLAAAGLSEDDVKAVLNA